MRAWVGLFRASEQSPPPRWSFDAEVFTDLEYASDVFTARVAGRRPNPPPLIVEFDWYGLPKIVPETRRWIIPDVDKTATLRLVPFDDATLSRIEHHLIHDITVKLSPWGHPIFIKTKEQ